MISMISIPFPYLSLFYPPIYLCSRVVVTQCDTPVSRSPVTLMWPHGSSGLCIPYLCWSAEYIACMLTWICGCHTVWQASLSVPCHTDVTSWVFRAMYTLLMLVCRVLSMYASLLMWVCRVRYICPVTHWLCINHFFHCYCDTHCPVTQSPLHTVTKPRPCPSYLLFQRHYLFSLHYHSWVTSWDPKHNLLLHTPAYPFHTQSRRHSVMNWCGICPIR